MARKKEPKGKKPPKGDIQNPRGAIGKTLQFSQEYSSEQIAIYKYRATPAQKMTAPKQANRYGIVVHTQGTVDTTLVFEDGSESTTIYSVGMHRRTVDNPDNITGVRHDAQNNAVWYCVNLLGNTDAVYEVHALDVGDTISTTLGTDDFYFIACLEGRIEIDGDQMDAVDATVVESDAIVEGRQGNTWVLIAR